MSAWPLNRETKKLSKVWNYARHLVLGRWSFANIFVTRNCNLRCEYCNVWKKRFSDLNLEDWCREIDVLAKHGCAHISLTGGEPTMRDDLTDLIRYINKKGISVSLVSNATLIDDDLVQALLKSGLDGFCASLDSLTDFGKHSRKVIEIAQEFARHIMVTLITVMTKKNLKEVLNITSMCDKFGFWHNPIIVQSMNGFFSSKCDELLPEANEMKPICDNLISLKVRGAPIVPTLEYLARVPDFCDGKKWVCQPFKHSITLNNDGRVMICQELKPFNVRLSDIEDNTEVLRNLTSSFSCNGCLLDCYFKPQTNRNLHFLRDSILLARSHLAKGR